MKFRFLTVDEDGMPWGFNDEARVEEVSHYQAVWNLETGEVHANWEGASIEKLKIRELPSYDA